MTLHVVIALMAHVGLDEGFRNWTGTPYEVCLRVPILVTVLSQLVSTGLANFLSGGLALSFTGHSQ